MRSFFWKPLNQGLKRGRGFVINYRLKNAEVARVGLLVGFKHVGGVYPRQIGNPITEYGF